jgi:hypothetical protein
MAVTGGKMLGESGGEGPRLDPSSPRCSPNPQPTQPRQPHLCRVVEVLVVAVLTELLVLQLLEMGCGGW